MMAPKPLANAGEGPRASLILDHLERLNPSFASGPRILQVLAHLTNQTFSVILVSAQLRDLLLALSKLQFKRLDAGAQALDAVHSVRNYQHFDTGATA